MFPLCRAGLAGPATRWLIAAAAMALAGAAHAQTERYVGRLTMPGGQTVVVAEGDFEARSVGSYSLRLYQAASAPDETTFFQAGLVRPRGGSVERLLLADVAGDRQPELVVVVRSAGSGGHLSAEAYAVQKDRLSVRASVEGLPADADPVAALRRTRRR